AKKCIGVVNISSLHGTFRETDKWVRTIGTQLLTEAQLNFRLADPGLAQQRQRQSEACAKVVRSLLEHFAEIGNRIEKLTLIHVELAAFQPRFHFLRPEFQPARVIGLGFTQALLLDAAASQGLYDLEIIRTLLQNDLQGAFGLREIRARIKQ